MKMLREEEEEEEEDQEEEEEDQEEEEEDQEEGGRGREGEAGGQAWWIRALASVNPPPSTSQHLTCQAATGWLRQRPVTLET